MSMSSLAAGFFFGVWGVYFVKRGRQQANLVAVGIGLVLMVYPYFVSNELVLWGLGFLLLWLGFR